MPTILGAVALFVLAAYIAHVTGNPENFLWTIVAVPFVIPVTAIVLWIIGKLLAAFRGPPPSP
ncbi:hypothetical protein [Stappia sp. P2PMeth1]|uniref:hypothetical protein n=1 Tax=Stappia sp. P2PMeth1 TaxID=2003586 RepID=UPI001647B8B1|nr:hypothetical protein [Stappia sp. P2PMeth1]